ncbi:MAG: thiamine pyrophosphate-binding protein [Desulfobacterales bacterium]|jgi:acetolactate synthase-1/2/3 large subunit|nr:thiamine pyrophosphate-binding protein [Desulfobacterales bacterium]MDP6807656.1 thiamine pyrophosphate-binding protein [Desulfobacterales bacterium]|tara:strand:- start:4324 stop:6075 length:1752 start_codon:yes stop_codon:yes gene_type:complete
MGEYTGAEVLVKALKNEGVQKVFSISGHGLVAMMEALRLEDGIDFFSTRHEENAAHMADGWARATGQIGVCCSTVGSGAANMASGLYEAYADSSPVLAITANVQTFLSYPFVGALEDMDTLSYYSPITKWNAAVHQWSRIPELVQRAFREALTGRPGPVHLDIPLDILLQKGELDDLPVPENYRPIGRLRGDQGQIDKAAQILLDAERPLLVAGGGVIASEAWEEFQSSADFLGAAATTTPMGSGAVSAHNTGFFGDGGWLGGNAVLQALQEADVIVAVGCHFSSWLGLGQPPVMPARSQQKIVQIDIDPTQLGKKVPIEIGITGDAKAVLADLLVALKENGGKGKADDKWTAGLVTTYKQYLTSLEPMLGGETGPITMARLAREVGEYLTDKEAMVTIDGGMVFHWGFTYLNAHKPRRRFFFAGGGHLGCGQPFANAFKLAFPDRPVLNFCGDGAFGLTLQELDTAVRHKLPVVHVINNDGGWGMCKAGQLALYGENALEGIDQDFSSADYAEIAKGFGCYGERVKRTSDISPALERAFTSGKPAVLDVKTQLTPHPMFGVMAQVVFQGVPLSMPDGPSPGA